MNEGGNGNAKMKDSWKREKHVKRFTQIENGIIIMRINNLGKSTFSS